MCKGDKIKFTKDDKIRNFYRIKLIQETKQKVCLWRNYYLPDVLKSIVTGSLQVKVHLENIGSGNRWQFSE